MEIFKGTNVCAFIVSHTAKIARNGRSKVARKDSEGCICMSLNVLSVASVLGMGLGGTSGPHSSPPSLTATIALFNGEDIHYFVYSCLTSINSHLMPPVPPGPSFAKVSPPCSVLTPTCHSSLPYQKSFIWSPVCDMSKT